MTTGRINQVTTNPKDVRIHAASFANHAVLNIKYVFPTRMAFVTPED